MPLLHKERILTKDSLEKDPWTIQDLEFNIKQGDNLLRHPQKKLDMNK